jgi:His-Xaa-Ser system protein HxsD
MIKIILNKNIYSLDIIFSACYTLMDKAYFLFDEDKNQNYIINIEPKEGFRKLIENQFKEELLSCLTYKKQVGLTKEIRETILKRALLLGEKKNEDQNNL